MGLSKEFILKSIEDYEHIIQDYQQMLIDNENKIKSPETSQKKKVGFQLLNKKIKQEIKSCQEQIKRLINE